MRGLLAAAACAACVFLAAPGFADGPAALHAGLSRVDRLPDAAAFAARFATATQLPTGDDPAKGMALSGRAALEDAARWAESTPADRGAATHAMTVLAPWRAPAGFADATFRANALASALSPVTPADRGAARPAAALLEKAAARARYSAAPTPSKLAQARLDVDFTLPRSARRLNP